MVDYRLLPRLGGVVLAACFLSIPQSAQTRTEFIRRVIRRVTATGYCLGPCRTCETRGLTATGTRSRRGAAVARRGRPQVAPLGSRIHVPGYGWTKVDDVGGGVGSRQVDLRFKTHRLASRWGKRTVRIVALIRGRR
ncbi:MAG: 3D domain-containing protein [Armatimonadota bacterium]